MVVAVMVQFQYLVVAMADLVAVHIILIMSVPRVLEMLEAMVVHHQSQKALMEEVRLVLVVLVVVLRKLEIPQQAPAVMVFQMK